MKKTFILVFGLVLSSLCFAIEEPVDLTIEPIEQTGPGHRSPALLPSLTFEDNSLYVYAPYYIESMTVLVKDDTGSVIYTYTAAMAAGRNTIVLPDTVSEEKYSIELLFGSWHLTGYF